MRQYGTKTFFIPVLILVNIVNKIILARRNQTHGVFVQTLCRHYYWPRLKHIGAGGSATLLLNGELGTRRPPHVYFHGIDA
jgi:hypothetical protein